MIYILLALLVIIAIFINIRSRKVVTETVEYIIKRNDEISCKNCKYFLYALNSKPCKKCFSLNTHVNFIRYEVTK